jgi:hypothetical protein
MATEARAGAFKHFDLFEQLKLNSEQKVSFDVIVPDTANFGKKGDEPVELPPHLRSSLVELVKERTGPYLSAAISTCGAAVHLSNIVLSPPFFPGPELEALVTVTWPNSVSMTAAISARLKPVQHIPEGRLPTHLKISTISPMDIITYNHGLSDLEGGFLRTVYNRGFVFYNRSSHTEESYNSASVANALKTQHAKAMAVLQQQMEKFAADSNHPLGKSALLLTEKGEYFADTVLQGSLQLNPAECFSIIGSELPWTAKEVIRRYCSASLESLQVSLPVKPLSVKVYDWYFNPELPFVQIHSYLVMERLCNGSLAKWFEEAEINGSSAVVVQYELFHFLHNLACTHLMEWRYPNGQDNDSFGKPPTLLLTIERSFEFEKQHMSDAFRGLYGEGPKSK